MSHAHFNPGELRDPRGKWTRGGSILHRLAREAGGEPAHREDSLAHYTRPDGSLAPERAKLHKDIVASILAGHKPQAHPHVTYFGGGPASGKSSTLHSVGTDNAIIAADDIKDQLPEFRKMFDAGDSGASGYVHEESTEIAKEAQRAAESRRVNFTLDGLGDTSIERMTQKVNAARAAGYQVHARYVTVDTETAVKRSEARAAELVRQGKVGRTVPASVIRATHANVSQVFPAAIKANLFDSAELWDNNVPKGSAGRLIARKQPGKPFEVLDNQAYNRFLAKAKK